MPPEGLSTESNFTKFRERRFKWVDANAQAVPSEYSGGLTKREHFAGVALQAIAAQGVAAPYAAAAAVEYADELIAALNRDPS